MSRLNNKSLSHKIFVSHFTGESRVANALKRFLEEGFSQAIQVFVSSNPWSLQAGDPWQGKVRMEIEHARLLCALMGPQSATRPWIFWEAGAAWGLKKTIIPLLHRGVSSHALPKPFSELQALTLTDVNGVIALRDRIDQLFDLKSSLTPDKCNAFSKEIEDLGRVIEAETKPEDDLSNVHFILYSKSHLQKLANAIDAGPNLIAHFRKPNLSRIFEALRQTGQTHSHIVSLDEFWVRPLAESSRLHPLTDIPEFKLTLKELRESVSLNGTCWAMPHFMDFSYYSIPKEGYDETLSSLRAMMSQIDYTANLASLRRRAKTDTLFAYDFHTPDTVAAVMFEFLLSIGNGATTFSSRESFRSHRNAFALQCLRDLVGPHSSSDFAATQPLEPMNMDSLWDKVILLRHWHSMATDESESRKHFRPIPEFPIRGTLGGWHLGIAACPPFPPEGSLALRKLVLRERQQQRFKDGAGLPTLEVFYEDPPLASFRDPITNWTLREIRRYVRDRLLKRSEFAFYERQRHVLAELHNDLMFQSQESPQALLNRWAADWPEPME